MVFINSVLGFAPALNFGTQVRQISSTTPLRPPSSFHGRSFAAPRAPPIAAHNRQSCRRSTTRMLVDPWSVSPATLDALAAQFFALSLAPYLTFLYFLNRPQVACPPLANFGFRFLLVFVFATIPAGIYAKIHYHDILANVDLLHGSAESLLTITNLLVVLGFRRAMQAESSKPPASTAAPKSTRLSAQALPLLLLPFAALSLTVHPEPANALSFPTWIIHVSSLIEWLAAMGLVWRYADTTSNPRWKGLTWGMLPLHTSGICACTYHLFYNSPNLNSLVTLQAFLTCFGNGTMAYAAYRIAQWSSDEVGDGAAVETGGGGMVGFEDLAELRDSDATFLGKVFLLSALGSVGVKWGELVFDQVFHPELALALAVVGIPTALNMLKWAVRSTGDEKFGKMF